jgi:GT2 family glycosyltransferase
MNTSIAVLIACYNRKAKTLSCLNALFNCTLPDFTKLEVFLVDDESTDGTPDAVHATYPQVKIIKGNGNLYWNRGMHLAWKHAAKSGNSDFYLWLNDDTLLLPDALEKIVLASGKFSNESIIVGSTCSSITNTLTYGGYLLGRGIITPNETIQQCDYFNGNCVFIPKKVFHSVGNLDPLFHHAIGDLDYGLRARKAEVKCYIVERFIGYCEDHERLPIWCLNEYSLLNRIRSLYSPLGNSHPYFFFRYELRHFGLHKALLHFFSIHLRLFFPWIWKQ